MVPHGAIGQALEILERREAAGVVALLLERAELCCRLQERDEQCLEHRARPDHPGGHAVNARVEVIQADVNAILIAAAHDLLREGDQFLVERHHMIAVPAHAAADVEEHLVKEGEYRAEFVGDDLGRMVVPRVESEEESVLDRVGEVELVGADHATLRADAEELRLHGVEEVRGVHVGGKDLVEGLAEPLTVRLSVHGGILESVGNPEIADARSAQLTPHEGPDLTAHDPVLDPEAADALVRVREGKAVRRLRVRKKSPVEIEPDLLPLRPVHPSLKVAGFEGIAVHTLPTRLGVEGVEGEAVAARQEAEDHLEVGAKFLRGPRTAGIVPRRHDPTGETGLTHLKTANVVPLPAVQGDRDAGEALERGTGVHSERGKGSPRGLVVRGNERVGFRFHEANVPVGLTGKHGKVSALPPPA